MRGDELFSESWKYHQESREYCVPSFQRDSGKPQNPHIEQIKPIFGTGFNTPKEIFFFKKVDTLWKRLRFTKFYRPLEGLKTSRFELIKLWFRTFYEGGKFETNKFWSSVKIKYLKFSIMQFFFFFSLSLFSLNTSEVKKDRPPLITWWLVRKNINKINLQIIWKS